MASRETLAFLAESLKKRGINAELVRAVNKTRLENVRNEGRFLNLVIKG